MGNTSYSLQPILTHPKEEQPQPTCFALDTTLDPTLSNSPNPIRKCASIPVGDTTTCTTKMSHHPSRHHHTAIQIATHLFPSSTNQHHHHLGKLHSVIPSYGPDTSNLDTTHGLEQNELVHLPLSSSLSHRMPMRFPESKFRKVTPKV